MDETINELPDSQKPADELSPEIQQQIEKKAEEKQAKLYARLKETERERDELKTKLTDKPVEKTPEKSPEKSTASDDLETALRLRSEGYSDAEILTLRLYSRKMGTPIDEIVKDPFIKSGLEAERQKAKVEQATPPSSNRSVVFNNNKTWGQMTEEERKANFGQMLQSKARDGNE